MFSNMKPLQLTLRHTNGVGKRLIFESDNSIPTSGMWLMHCRNSLAQQVLV